MSFGKGINKLFRWNEISIEEDGRTKERMDDEKKNYMYIPLPCKEIITYMYNLVSDCIFFPRLSCI